MKINRIQQVEKYLSDHGTATIPELSSTFNVSINTVRRDLKILKDASKIDLIYGGAKIRTAAENASDPLVSYAERNVFHSYEKDNVAKAAASLVSENDVIFIDTGTSTVPLMHYLSSFKHLTVITNSVYILYSCIECPSITAIGLPGILKNKTASLVGSETERALDSYNSIDKAFMACSSFSIENGACNSSPEEQSIKRLIMKKSRQRCLLLDDSKLGQNSLLTYAGPDEFEYIITDQHPQSLYLDYFEQHRIHLVIADEIDD